MERLTPEFDTIREALIALPASGEGGFEGLVAACLADLSGMHFRLAKAGSQSGRDGSTPLTEFSIAFEAKLYTAAIRTQELLGKAYAAANALDGRLDLWVLAATVSIGENDVRQVTEALESSGISCLIVDWSAFPLPRLAVLLAAAQEATIRWFERHHSGTASRNELQSSLARVAADRQFVGQLAELRRDVAAPHVGLPALQRTAEEWLRSRFSSREDSRISFGQDVAILQPDVVLEHRCDLVRALGTEMERAISDGSPVVVLGEEGTGKSWVIAEWWNSLDDRPVVLFVAGRRVELLSVNNPLQSLAKVLADQHGMGNTSDAAIASWRRRLDRWASGEGKGKLRFVLVLDGVNEHGRFDWADTVRSHAHAMTSLGGVVVVTARTEYWRRDIAPHLPDSNAKPVLVPSFSEPELSALLSRAGQSVAGLPQHVVAFMRNPRSYSVAIRLLSRANLDVGELSIGRLLFEYWRARREDRGNLLTHGIDDLHELLRRHARQWLEEPNRLFKRDEWTRYSGAAERDGLDRVRNDLTEIEEGRFLAIAKEDTRQYAFRAEVLPFALGLLVEEELREALRDPGQDPDEVVAAIVEPVRGFDLVSEVLAAAVGLALLSTNHPIEGRRALLRAWLELQNVLEISVEEMTAFLPSDPGVFLDVAESPVRLTRRIQRPELIGELLRSQRRNPSVNAAIRTRATGWLTRWTLAPDPRYRKVDEDKQAARVAEVDARIGLLSPADLAWFRRATVQSEDPTDLQLDGLAMSLIAGGDLLPFSEAFVGWALARAIVQQPYHAAEDLAWALRLNRRDPTESTREIARLLETVDEHSAEPIRAAAAMLLRMTGDEAAARRAETLRPRFVGQRWRRVEKFCDTNPHDPAARECSNLDRALETLGAVAATDLWTSISMTSQDMDLRDLTPALARFAPDQIASFLREVVRTASVREATAFRQLALSAAELSPLFGSEELAAVRFGYERLLRHEVTIRDDEEYFVLCQLASARFPHLAAAEQLDDILNLPPACPPYTVLQRGLRLISSSVLESTLRDAWARRDEERLSRIFFFAAESASLIPSQLKPLVIDAIAGPNKDLAASAAFFALAARDSELNRALLDRAAMGTWAIAWSDDTYQIDRAIARAAIDLRDPRAVHFLNPEMLPATVAALGDPAVDRLAELIDETIRRGLAAPSVTPPGGVVLTREQGLGGLDVVNSFDERSGAGRSSITLDDLNKPEEDWLTRDAARQLALRDAVERFQAELGRNGLAALASAPGSEFLEVVVQRHRVMADKWLRAILLASDRQLAPIRNLAVAVAGAYAGINPGVAAEALARLRDISWFMRVTLDGVELYDRAVFAAPRSLEIDALRADRFDRAATDEELEAHIEAAEKCGCGAWLSEYVAAMAKSATPGNRARALYISGLRLENDQSDTVLTQSGGIGFLRDVRDLAVKNYSRDAWARYWVRNAMAAQSRVDFWRFGKLAEGVVDSRLNRWASDWTRGDCWEGFGGELAERLRAAAEGRSKKRKETLLGTKPPSRALAEALDAAAR